MSYLECPYCEHDCGDYFDDQHTPDVEYEHECDECGKIFIFVIDYYPTFSGHKADCLNGADHNYEEMCGCPKEYFLNKRKCSMCSKEITLKEGDEGYADNEENATGESNG